MDRIMIVEVEGLERAGELNKWLKMVFIVLLGFGGSFEACIWPLSFCSIRPSRICRGAVAS